MRVEERSVDQVGGAVHEPAHALRAREGQQVVGRADVDLEALTGPCLRGLAAHRRQMHNVTRLCHRQLQRDVVPEVQGAKLDPRQCRQGI